MDELKYQPVAHDQTSFLKRAMKRDGFKKAYNDLGEEYTLIHEMLAARAQAGLTQEAVAKYMGTTKSAISRLESLYKHTPSINSLKKYAQAVGCLLEIRFIPNSSQPTGVSRSARNALVNKRSIR